MGLSTTLNLSILSARADVSFAPAQSIPIASSFATALAVGDLDGDGDLDIVVGSSSGAITVIENDGDAGFVIGQSITVEFEPSKIDIGDLDGDGDLDLAMTSSSGPIKLFTNNGDGTFGIVQDISVYLGAKAVTIGDLDKDGDQDLVFPIASSSGYSLPSNVGVLLNTGDGTFSDVSRFSACDGPFSVTVADLDGDGDNDIPTFCAYYSSSFSLLRNNGDTTFSREVTGLGGRIIIGGVIGDLDGDGDLDPATISRDYYDNESVLVLKNNGDATAFEKVDSPVIPATFIATDLTKGDLDKDGDLDLIVPGGTSGILLLTNDGSGKFTNEEVLDTDASFVATGDFNGDGKIDLASIIRGGDGVSVLLNTTPSQTAPTITSLAPLFGPIGTEVTITGTGFTGATAVTFRLGFPQHQLPAEFTVVSDTEIRAVVPAEAKSGRVTVKTPAGSATSSRVFKVVGP